MKTQHKKSEAPSQRKGSRAVTGLLLLAVAAVVVGTVIVAAYPPGEGEDVPDAEPGLSEPQRRREQIEDLIARADALAVGSDAERIARLAAYKNAADLARAYIRRIDPRDIVVRPLLATAQLRMGQTAEAEATVDELLRLAPQAPEGLWIKGELLAARNDPAADDYLRRAVQRPDATAEMWAGWGGRLLSLGRADQARPWLERAYKAGHRQPAAMLALGMAAMTQEDYGRAIEVLSAAARSHRPGPKLLALLAEAQKNAGRLTAAEATLRQALDLADAPALRVALGDVLVLRKRRVEAAEAYAAAADAPRPDPRAAFKAARCYYLEDRHALAMKYIDRAAAATPSPEVLRWRQRIEDARFPAPDTDAPTFRLTPPPTADANTAPEPTTRPFEGFRLR